MVNKLVAVLKGLLELDLLKDDVLIILQIHFMQKSLTVALGILRSNETHVCVCVH